MSDSSDVTENNEVVVNSTTENLKSSRSGIVCFAIGMVFFGSMIVLIMQAGILVLTNEDGILNIPGMSNMINSYMVTAAPWSVIGIIAGTIGFKQEDKSKVLAGWGLVFNFINLNGALLCLVILNIGNGM